MRRGDIGYAHLKVMARTAESVGPVFDEKKLLKLAKENSPGKFHFSACITGTLSTPIATTRNMSNWPNVGASG